MNSEKFHKPVEARPVFRYNRKKSSPSGGGIMTKENIYYMDDNLSLIHI